MSHFLKIGFAFVTLAALGGCAPDYSPNTYNAAAVQQANKVDPAIVVGFREVSISAAGTVGAVTGGAAGGILGAQVGPTSTASALGAVGGGIVGSLLGTGIEHVTADTIGWEYIVQKPNGDLLSVTQREPEPLPVGEKVLVIAGNQARIIPDTRPEPPAKDKPKPVVVSPAALPPAATSIDPLPGPVTTSPLPPPDATAAPVALVPVIVAPAAPPHSAWDSRAPTPVPVNPAPAPDLEPSDLPLPPS